MPRIRDPNRDKAFEIYKARKGGIELVEIASQLSVPPGTVRGWKAKDKWEDKLNGTFQKEKVKNTERSKKNVKSDKKGQISKEIKQLDKSELTDKQKLFCIYYAKCFNATKAYLKAYDCSYDTAMTNGCELLRNTKIKDEVTRLKQNKLNRAMLEEDDIFQKMIDIAFADITDYLEFGQEEKPVMTMYGPLEVEDPETGEKTQVTQMVNTVRFKQSTEIDGTIISEVKQGRDGASIKLQDKMKALQWLADRMDLLTTETQRKLEFEQQKVAIAKAKVEAPEEDEVEDDGFMDALKGKVENIWEE